MAAPIVVGCISIFAKGEQPTRSNDIALLEYIAAQCPYIGGNAVFEARGLLALIGKEGIYDDPTTCLAQGINLRKKPVKTVAPSNKSFASVSPNPSNQYFNLAVSDDLIGSVYSIIDATGKIVLEKKVNNIKENIDITSFVAGFYYIKITRATEGATIVPIKLVVVK